MNSKKFYSEIIVPALFDVNRELGIPFSEQASRFLLAVALQETALSHRYQQLFGYTPGPSKGWWKFERHREVVAVLNHHKTKDKAKAWCKFCDVECVSSSIWRALEGHDYLAVGFARMLVWTSPKTLPKVIEEGWVQYNYDLWRPGKPRYDEWVKNWEEATGVAKDYHQ